MAKSMAKKIARPPRKTAAAPKKLPTRESLIVKMGKVLDDVDRIFPKTRAVRWSWPSGELLQAREACDRLLTQMNKLIAPNEAESAEWLFRTALSAKPGTVPSLARPGCFVEWVGYIPVLCIWGGFITRDSDIRMVDPAEMWINGSGYQSMNIQPEPSDMDVRKLFRYRLETLAALKDFKLHDVEDYGRKGAVGRLAEQPWLQEVLERGETDAIPFPGHMQAVQQSLFG